MSKLVFKEEEPGPEGPSATTHKRNRRNSGPVRMESSFIRSPFTAVTKKSWDEQKPQSSQLHRCQTDDNSEAEPSASRQQLNETTVEDLNLQGTSIQIVTQERNHLVVMTVEWDLAFRVISRRLNSRFSNSCQLAIETILTSDIMNFIIPVWPLHSFALAARIYHHSLHIYYPVNSTHTMHSVSAVPGFTQQEKGNAKNFSLLCYPVSRMDEAKYRKKPQQNL